jgi:hypothetical protein
MAKKPIKKSVHRSAAGCAMASSKPAARPAAAAAAPAACTCGCGCRGGFWHFMKKLLVFLIIFALGWCACKFICCGCKHKGFGGAKPEFVDGCMDVNRDISRMNEMALKHIEGLRNMDADVNGCITPEEFKAARKQMWKNREHKIERAVADRVERAEQAVGIK